MKTFTPKHLILTAAVFFLVASTLVPFDSDARRIESLNLNTRTSINRNLNVNRNVNINRHVDVDVHGGYYGYYGHPVARGVAFGTAAAVTAAAIGSIVYTLPTACAAVRVGNVSYQQCGSTWYQPQYVGTSVQYVAVNPPH